MNWAAVFRIRVILIIIGLIVMFLGVDGIINDRTIIQNYIVVIFAVIILFVSFKGKMFLRGLPWS